MIGLTRISYRDNEVNDKTDYTYDDTAGQGVVVWVIDTGVNHFDPDFEGRVAEGRAFCTGCYAPVPDPNGHGTAVAALIASKTWGVAKRARIVSIRALNEDGVGRWSDVIAALQWVRSMMLRRQFRSARGHIVNLSIEGPINAVVNRMLRQLENLGATIVVAAGNSAVDACTTSPASATAMLNNMVVVGASTADDQPAYFTNVGTCVDVFGPGDEVVTYVHSIPLIGDMAVSGTSFASPHVAGTMALYLSANSRLSTFLLKAVLQRQATRGKVHGAEQSQSPNLLVFNSLQGARLPWWMLRGGRW
ncbi:peptidase S8/S53 domain-containing protein [Catenaria anguillulae PL171]|uniref:Peptidase S8/S53 domain-containing protein n=1 Tax=Catenaria anguillulae PL171 TaxID=765915 RepID=A0A1Y2H6L3_9FUNG|nr:peptidase S8/S53 domain-containing protein [Catenaria anguillulae PL171]